MKTSAEIEQTATLWHVRIHLYLIMETLIYNMKNIMWQEDNHLLSMFITIFSVNLLILGNKMMNMDSHKMN